ncbi:hypothetical protein JW906_01155 [bacterium]|nr:hypothetical protein [bacterium]
MTSKQRMMAAFRKQIPDRVPVCPDISVMVPDRLTGKPFYEIHLDGREHNGWTSATHSEVYVDAVRHFGMEGIYMYGGLKEIRPEGAPEFESAVFDAPEGKRVKRICRTKTGDLTEEEIYFADEPPWRQSKPVKDLRKDFKSLKQFIGEGGWKWEKSFRDYGRIGDSGVYAGMVPVFQDWWFHNRHGGFEQVYSDFLMESDFMDEVHAFWMEWSLALIQAMVEAKPDIVMLGGSSASLSVSSPDFFRKYELPFVRESARLCRAGGVPSHLHVCGRSWKLVELVAAETDLDSMEPLEEPPCGDVDIREAKRRVGKKLCIKGNINTTEFMLRATPDQVEEKCKALIDAAAADGGFILSTGDQCGRDTPDENFFRMVEAAEKYGRY